MILQLLFTCHGFAHQWFAVKVSDTTILLKVSKAGFKKPFGSIFYNHNKYAFAALFLPP